MPAIQVNPLIRTEDARKKPSHNPPSPGDTVQFSHINKLCFSRYLCTGVTDCRIFCKQLRFIAEKSLYLTMTPGVRCEKAVGSDTIALQGPDIRPWQYKQLPTAALTPGGIYGKYSR